MPTVSWSGGGCENVGGVLTLPCILLLIPLAIQLAFFFLGGVALIFLMWGSLRFITSQGDPKGLQAAKNTMTWAFFGLVFVLCVYGVVNFLINFLGLPYANIMFGP